MGTLEAKDHLISLLLSSLKARKDILDSYSRTSIHFRLFFLGCGCYEARMFDIEKRGMEEDQRFQIRSQIKVKYSFNLPPSYNIKILNGYFVIRYLDMSRNQISDLKACVKMLVR